MLTRILHALVANPRVYNLVMLLFGSRVTLARLRRLAQMIAVDLDGKPRAVIDVGGGTGLYQTIWGADTTYLCVDPDPRKVQGFVPHASTSAAIVAIGDRLPFQDASVDVVMMVAVSHHLVDETFDAVLAEVRRVLRPDGRLLYLDAVWNARFLTGRLLWRYDRGAYPRRPEVLVAYLSRHFRSQHRERYKILHDYVTWIGTPLPLSSGPSLRP